jgi:hypothetical protein
MITFLALLLTIAGTPNRTDWMRLEAFHLSIGMSRAEAIEALEAWEPKRGNNDDEVVVDYDGDKAITLEFRKDRLQSARFELFVLLPEVRSVFEEERAYLAGSRGVPRKETRSVLIYDTALPNLMVVAADDPNSEQGKKGVGVLAVRYYDPR